MERERERALTHLHGGRGTVQSLIKPGSRSGWNPFLLTPWGRTCWTHRRHSLASCEESSVFSHVALDSPVDLTRLLFPLLLARCRSRPAWALVFLSAGVFFRVEKELSKFNCCCLHVSMFWIGINSKRTALRVFSFPEK